MGGSPEKSTSSSVSGSAQQWAQPYATQGAQSVLDVYKAQQPALTALQGNLNGQLGALQGQGRGLGANVAQANATGNQANGYLNKVLSGGYMSGNPYIQQMLGTLDEGILNNVNSGFETAGRYGSGNYVGELAKQIGATNSNVLYGNYSDEMNRMGTAAQQAQAAQIAAQQAQSANSQQQLAATGMAAQLPYTGMQNLGQSLGTLFNGGTSNSTSTGAQKGLLDYAMQGAQTAAVAFSDRRLKTKIELLSRDPDGLGHYRFAYRSAPDLMLEGVMADEVKELRPNAYVPNYQGSGFDAVNYAAL